MADCCLVEIVLAEIKYSYCLLAARVGLKKRPQDLMGCPTMGSAPAHINNKFVGVLIIVLSIENRTPMPRWNVGQR